MHIHVHKYTHKHISKIYIKKIGAQTQNIAETEVVAHD